MIAERVAVHAIAPGCGLVVLEAGGVRGLGEVIGGPELAGELLAGQPRHPAARAAWACAELDLAARTAGRSAAELLGGRRRSRVRCAHRVRTVSPAGVAREVEAAAAAGFVTFDLVAVARGGAYDLERLGAARWAAGRAAVLRLALGGPAERERHTLRMFDPLVVVGPGDAIDPVQTGGPAVAYELARVAGAPVLLRSAPVTAVGLAAVLHVACALELEPLDCGLAISPAEQPWLTLPEGPGLGVEPYRLAR